MQRVMLGLIVAGTLAVSSVAQSASFTGYGVRGDKVSDPVLAQIRGRFVDGSKVLFFGVEMNSYWKTATGEIYKYGLNLDLDLSNQYKPAISIYRNGASGTSTQSVSAGLSNVSNDSLNDISGVVQNIQIAGDGNGVKNAVQWDITDKHFGGSSGGGTKVTSGGAETLSGGAVLDMDIGKNKVGYSIVVPGVGKVVQGISGGSVRGLVQSTQLGGSYNSVYNSSRLRVVLNPQQSGKIGQGVNQSLRNLIGIR